MRIQEYTLGGWMTRLGCIGLFNLGVCLDLVM